MEGPRLRPRTALGVWVTALFLAVVLGALGELLDSSYLRYLAGLLSLLVVWEAFLKSLVLGLVLLPVVAIKTRRGRKRNKATEDFWRRQMMKLGAEVLIETLEKGYGHPEERQEIIDRLDELNDNFYA